MEEGSSSSQSVWRYIRERCSTDPAQLRSLAVADCTRMYTYEQMFREWEAYARVFSALGMTGKNEARVGIAGAICAEPLFAFFGLNMTGAAVSMISYPDFLPTGLWKTMVKKEKLTDLILTDIMVTPDLWNELQKERESLGIRNVILMHSRLGGPCVGPAELVFNELNYRMLKGQKNAVFMDELIRRYASAPIVYGEESDGHIALITHTSGTTKGTRKPLPYRDAAINSALAGFGGDAFKDRNGCMESGQLRFAPSIDFSSFLSFCQTIAYLSLGNTVVLTFFGSLHPKFIRAVAYYKLNILYVPGFILDRWIERGDSGEADFSSLAVLACGGSYISPEKLRKYAEFAQKHGYRHAITQGYGMSETGGAELYVPEGCGEDILGFPRVKENFRFRDENDQKFYTVDDGVRTGVMYVASDSLCLNELDGEILFAYTEIDGKNFICTNDLVRVNENGSLSYAGRADRYFINNDGVRFDPGVVEVEMSRQPGIDRCAVVPAFDRRIHDTVPVLYVVPAEKGPDAAGRVRQALEQAFLRDGKLADTNLPSQFVLTDDIPLNANGKIDIYRITRERLAGQAYNIVPIRENSRVTDIKIELAPQLDSATAGTLPEGMGGGSGLGLVDIFNAPPPKSGPFRKRESPWRFPGHNRWGA